MKAGFFESDITPAIGMEVPGDYIKHFNSRIHDPLKARAAVFETEGERIALAGIDSCMIRSRKEVLRIRERVEKLCGIKTENIMVAASHTHSGGPFSGFLAEEVADAPPFIRELVVNHSALADPAYNEAVVNSVVTAIFEADRRKKDAVVSAGSGCEDNVSFNRRFRMKNGKVFTHPGKANPDIIEPAGPIDPEVGVVCARGQDGGIHGCIVNFACHCTAGPGGVSADWLYYLEKTIRAFAGREAVVVFLNGACGDVTQVNNLSEGEDEFGEKWANIMGVSVGAEVIKVLARAETEISGPVAGVSKLLSFKRRLPAKESLEESRKIVEKGLADENMRTGWTLAKERLILEYIAGKKPDFDGFEIQAIQIGPAIFVSNPGELFCGLGLDIKEKVEFPLVFVVELANGCAGYIPDAEAFGPEGGGYETVLTSYSNLEAGTGEHLVKESVKLSKMLSPAGIPVNAKGELLRKPWGYGTMGPELE